MRERTLLTSFIFWRGPVTPWRWLLPTIGSICVAAGVFYATTGVVGWRTIVLEDLKAHPVVTSSWTAARLETEIERATSPEGKCLTCVYLVVGQFGFLFITALLLWWMLRSLGRDVALSVHLYVVAIATLIYEILRATLYAIMLRETHDAVALTSDSPLRLDLARFLTDRAPHALYVSLSSVTAIRGIYWLLIAIGLSMAIPKLRVRYALSCATALWCSFVLLHGFIALLY